LPQIVSEAHVRLASGRVSGVRRLKENHYLDCEAMQAVASHLLNVLRIGEGVRNAPWVGSTARPVSPEHKIENVAAPRPADVDDRGCYKHSAFPSAAERPSFIFPHGRQSWLDRNR
jgi:hypothetical protein